MDISPIFGRPCAAPCRKRCPRGELSLRKGSRTLIGMRARSKRLAGPPDAHRAGPRCGSGKGGLARAGDEGEEGAEFLAGLEGITAQVINRADRARTPVCQISSASGTRP